MHQSQSPNDMGRALATEAHRQPHAHAHTHACTRIAEGLRPALTGSHGRVRGANIESADQAAHMGRRAHVPRNGPAAR